MPEDQHSYSSYLFRRDLIQFQLANSRKIVSDLKQAGRGIDRGQGLCPPRYEHGNAADGHRPRSRRRSARFPPRPEFVPMPPRCSTGFLAWCRLGRRRPALPCPLCLRFTCAQRPARARKPRCRRSPWSSVPRQYRTPSNSPTKPAHGRITLGGLLIVAEPASEIYRPVHALASI